jgi:hypothetical protein
MDWEKASINQAGILGYPAEQGYHILSTAPTWQKGIINEARWENPLAYYNLANDQDNWPELLIRVFQPWKSYMNSEKSLPVDTLQVEYNWDQNNDGKWDYVEILAGRKSIKETIDFPDFSIRTVPFERLPGWVIGQKWDLAILVVGEDGGRGDSESLWVWNGFSDFQNNYLAGYSDTLDMEYLHDIAVGYRGEYSIDPGSQPVLYFSPMDQRLHQRGAQGGVWNLGNENYIRYANLDGSPGPVAGRAQGSVVQQLNYSDGIYVYSGSGRFSNKPKCRPV